MSSAPVVTRTRPRRRGWAVALSLAVAWSAGACQAEPAADDELADAVAATLADPVAYALSARADRAALDALGEDAVAAADFLEGASVTGAREPDGRLHVAVTLGGDAPLLEVITDGEQDLLLRTGLAEVLGVTDRDPLEALGPALEARGVDEAGIAALATSFAGGWVALTDVDGLDELVGATAGIGRATAPVDLAELLDAVTVTGTRDVGELRRLDVEVRSGALLGPLGFGAGDRTVPGTVDLRDGRLLEVRLALSGGDLAGAAGGAAARDGADDAGREADEAAAPGTVELVLRTDPLDPEDAIERPDPGASLTAAQLLALVEQLEGATPGDVTDVPGG